MSFVGLDVFLSMSVLHTRCLWFGISFNVLGFQRHMQYLWFGLSLGVRGLWFDMQYVMVWNNITCTAGFTPTCIWYGLEYRSEDLLGWVFTGNMYGLECPSRHC